MQVLKTRLYKPVIKPHYIARDAILKILDKNSNNPINLVVGGAGYGKSISISQWLDFRCSKYCWISLDTDCNDFLVFLSLLVNAVKLTYPQALKEIDSLVDTAENPVLKGVANLIINDLAELDEEFIVVLDDYQTIKNQQIHNLLNNIIKYPSHNLKLFILSRVDPPLKLNRQKVYGQVSEIRMSNLSFSTSEIISLAEKSYNLIIQPELADTLIQKTEGWILGIRLILKDLSDGKVNLEAYVKNYQGTENLYSYLMDEILMGQSQYMRRYLFLASLFNRFTLELVKKLALFLDNRIGTNEKINEDIDQFMNGTMFIVGLDDENVWFRFHHVIQEFLRKQARINLNNEQLNEIYETASSFFEENGLIDEAITYALEAKCFQKAIDIIHYNRHKALNWDRFDYVKRWLNLLPKDIHRQNVSLLLSRCMIHDAGGDYISMSDDLQMAEKLMKSYDPASDSSRLEWGEYHALQAGCSFYSGKIEKSIHHADYALELLQKDPDSYIHSFTLAFKVLSLNVMGNTHEAESLLQNTSNNLHPENRISSMRLESIKSLLFLINGRYLKLVNSGETSLRVSKEEGMWVFHAMAAYALTSHHYVQNELDQVQFYYNEITKDKYSGRPFWVIHVGFMSCLALLAKGDINELKNRIQSLYAYARLFENKRFETTVVAFEIEIALRINDISRAKKLGNKAQFDPYPPVFYYYFPQLTQIKLLMVEKDINHMEEVREMLENYLSLSTTINNITFRIQVLALYALWFYKKQDYSAAVEKLREVISYAKQGQFLRTFVDLGADMQKLLKKLSPSEQRSAFIQSICRIMKEEQNGLLKLPLNDSLLTRNDLKQREVSVLILVTKGYRNKEIAEELFLSESTIKTYLYRIYKKLDVKNRIEAINKANAFIENQSQ